MQRGGGWHWLAAFWVSAAALTLANPLAGRAEERQSQAPTTQPSGAEAEALIFARQQTMSQLAKDAELLGKIVAGSAPADKLAETTEAIAKGASDAVGDFANPVPGGHTRLEAWSNNADFNRRMAAFARDSAAMAKAGKTGDVMAVTALMIDGLPCKQCHDLYRERKAPGA